MIQSAAPSLRAFFTLAVLVVKPFNALASPERLRGFELRSCAPSGHCVHVRTAEARRSPLDSAYVFAGQTQVEIFAQSTDGRPLSLKKFAATSGTYDPEAGFVTLRGQPEAFIDLEAGELNILGHGVSASAGEP